MERISDRGYKAQIAREAGIRVEMLDFYMAKFQRKNMLELRGIDTSGIDDDIEDVFEWLRYCHWEMNQSLSMCNNNEVLTLFEKLGLKFGVDKLMEDGISSFYVDASNVLHVNRGCEKFKPAEEQCEEIPLVDLIMKLKNGAKYKFCPYCISEDQYDILQTFQDSNL